MSFHFRFWSIVFTANHLRCQSSYCVLQSISRRQPSAGNLPRSRWHWRLATVGIGTIGIVQVLRQWRPPSTPKKDARQTAFVTHYHGHRLYTTREYRLMTRFVVLDSAAFVWKHCIHSAGGLRMQCNIFVIQGTADKYWMTLRSLIKKTH